MLLLTEEGKATDEEKKIKVLMVDDSPYNLFVLEEILK